MNVNKAVDALNNARVIDVDYSADWCVVQYNGAMQDVMQHGSDFTVVHSYGNKENLKESSLIIKQAFRNAEH